MALFRLYALYATRLEVKLNELTLEALPYLMKSYKMGRSGRLRCIGGGQSRFLNGRLHSGIHGGVRGSDLRGLAAASQGRCKA
jgi:hypothetical protein